MFKFNENAIDLVKTYQRFSKKHGHRVVSRHRFGAPVVRMANAVITKHFDWESLKGVRACIEYGVMNIRWRNSIWIVPLFETRLFTWPYGESGGENISLLTDSIILSVVAYRTQLDEHHSGLSTLMLNDLILGLEWLCNWINVMGRLDSAQLKDVIEHLDVSEAIGWIEGQNPAAGKLS